MTNLWQPNCSIATMLVNDQILNLTGKVYSVDLFQKIILKCQKTKIVQISSKTVPPWEPTMKIHLVSGNPQKMILGKVFYASAKVS